MVSDDMGTVEKIETLEKCMLGKANEEDGLDRENMAENLKEG